MCYSRLGVCEEKHVLFFFIFSGKEAKDLFYKLRQKFGKEWRKFQTHQKGESGQGNAGPFISAWALYEDLKFLGDHITPRK